MNLIYGPRVVCENMELLLHAALISFLYPLFLWELAGAGDLGGLEIPQSF